MLTKSEALQNAEDLLDDAKRYALASVNGKVSHSSEWRKQLTKSAKELNQIALSYIKLAELKDSSDN